MHTFFFAAEITNLKKYLVYVNFKEMMEKVQKVIAQPA